MAGAGRSLIAAGIALVLVRYSWGTAAVFQARLLSYDVGVWPSSVAIGDLNSDGCRGLAPTVHAGWEGPLALEIINAGASPILMVPGMAIAQSIADRVRGCPIWNQSQFRGQSTPKGSVRG